MRACRGVGASMTAETLAKWDDEHRRMPEENAPEKFDVLHYVSVSELISKKYR